jgi:hypothetical protein
MRGISPKQILAVRCPTCGAAPREKCELSTGQPRTEPHRDRRLAASDKVISKHGHGEFAPPSKVRVSRDFVGRSGSGDLYNGESGCD